MGKQVRSLLGSKLIQSVDTTPFSEESSNIITTTLRASGFTAIDNGHHISISTPHSETSEDEWECGVIYLSDEQTMWIKVLAQRWWLLFTAGDRYNRYETLWGALDLIQPEPGGVINAGTVGELDWRKALKETLGRKPTKEEYEDFMAELKRFKDV